MSYTNEAIIEQLVLRRDLDATMIRELMERILSREMPPVQISAALALLRAKKESSVEISESADLIIKKAEPIERPDYLFADVVGTGGDGFNTINVSTISSLLAASLGLPMAKHGNTSVSSKCGAAEVLAELGIDIVFNAERAKKSLDENQWCFLYAPLYHSTYTSVKSIRRELKIRTIFNILGPLVNPLSPPIMIIGVYEPSLIAPFVQTLKHLGRRRAMIVHGAGLDEIALHGETTVAILDDQSIEHRTLSPKDFGLSSYAVQEIVGGDPAHNAKICHAILSGNASLAMTSIVAATTGALLWLAEKTSTLKEGSDHAMQALRAGSALTTLERLRRFGHGA